MARDGGRESGAVMKKAMQKKSLTLFVFGPYFIDECF